MTPLQGAMIAAAIANNGVQMRPYLVDTLQAPDLTTVVPDPAQGAAHAGHRRRSPRSCSEMMDSVVQNGTGRKAQIAGFEVGGKTGTAQNGDAAGDHGWFIGFVMKDGKPICAVAVFLENAGSGGSAEATRIAGEVMKAVIAAKGTQVNAGERRWSMMSPGTMLGGRYRLVERIAGGGMGDVWRGIDEVLGRTVAVKILLPALLEEPGFAERFRGEARTMATINHPGVVDIYDYGIGPGGRRLPGHGVRRGRRAVPHAGPGRPAHPGPHDGAGRPGRRRAAGRPRQGHRAPRREARQPARPPQRHAGADRLRHRPLGRGRPS